MFTKPTTVSIPTDDLEKAYRFYLEGIGLDLAAETDDDERPEPVVFRLSEGLNFMLVPREGFDWITPGNEVAKPGISECVLCIALDSEDEVNVLVERARRAGAAIPDEPSQRPWGYAGYFQDLDGHIWMALCEGGEQ